MAVIGFKMNRPPIRNYVYPRLCANGRGPVQKERSGLPVLGLLAFALPESRVFPAMKADNNRQACCMSNRDLSVSSRIKHHPLLGNGAKEVRITDGCRLDQVDLASE